MKVRWVIFGCFNLFVAVFLFCVAEGLMVASFSAGTIFNAYRFFGLGQLAYFLVAVFVVLGIFLIYVGFENDS